MEDDGRVLDIPLLYVLFLDIKLCDCIPYFFYTESSERIGKASTKFFNTIFICWKFSSKAEATEDWSIYIAVLS